MVAGQVDISSDMTVKLSAALGHSAESWLRLQEQYDLWHYWQSIDVNDFSKITFPVAS